MNRVALYHLETLLWIDRLGTFSAAADRLNTTQPAISARIRELEAHLGIALFTRQGRKMILSVQGRELVRQCEEIWPLLQQALLNPGDFSRATGIARIGSGEIAAASCLPIFVRQIADGMPALSLEIEIDLTTRLIDGLLSGVADLVFAIGPLDIPGIRTEVIGEIALTWLASPHVSEIISQEDIEDDALTFWSLARNSPMYSIMYNGLQDMGFKNVRMNTCNDVHSLIDIIASGGGISLFPVNMVVEKMAAGVMVRAFERSPLPILINVAMRSDERNPIIRRLFETAVSIGAQIFPLAGS